MSQSHFGFTDIVQLLLDKGIGIQVKGWEPADTFALLMRRIRSSMGI